MKYSAVIWDWNGTLLNDAPASLAAVNHIFGKMGVPLITESQYKEALDTPISKFYERFLDLGKVDTDLLSKQFYDYLDLHEDEIGLQPGAKETLRRLNEAGTKQYILSAAWNDDILPLLEKYSIEAYIDGVFGASDREIGSKLERAVEMAHKYSFGGRSACLVGDTYHDFECAKAIDADCLLISCGHQNVEKISRSGLPVYPTFAEMSEHLFS